MATDESVERDRAIRVHALAAAEYRQRLVRDVEALGRKFAPQNLRASLVRSARRHPGLVLGISLLGVGLLLWRARRA